MGFWQGVLGQLGFEVKRIDGGETKAAGDYSTAADAFASTLGTNFNENYSSFNNQKQQLQSYVEWVYAAVHAIAEHCAAIDFRLYQNNTKIKNASIGQKLIYYPKEITRLQQNKVDIIEQKDGGLSMRQGASPLEELESHPLLDLLHCPNPYMVKNEFLEVTFIHMMLTGDAFWAIARDKKGVPAEMWPLMPDRVTVVPDTNKFVIGYTYQVNGEQVKFAPDDIVHHKLSNPVNFHRGYSPIMAGARTIDADAHASNWNRMTMYNRATPSGVFQTDAKLDDKVFKRLKQEIADTFGGASNHDRPAVLEQGLSFKPISMSAKDMDFLNLRNFNRDQILVMLGVPKSVLGLDESMSRSNAETSEYVFSKRNRNKMQRLTNRITEDLAIQFGSNLVVSFTDPVPEDKQFILQETQAALGGVGYQRINEERAKRGDDPVPGGDEIWIQSTMVPLSVALDNAKNPQPQVAPIASPDTEQDINDEDTDEEESSADDGSGDNTDANNDSGSGNNSTADNSGSTTSEGTNDSGNATQGAAFTDAQMKQLKELFATVKVPSSSEEAKEYALANWKSLKRSIKKSDYGPNRDVPDGHFLCECCDGWGEHDTGYECYRCDASGTVTPKENEQPIPCGGRADSTELYLDENGIYQHVKSGQLVTSASMTTAVPHIWESFSTDSTLPSFPAPLHEAEKAKVLITIHKADNLAPAPAATQTPSQVDEAAPPKQPDASNDTIATHLTSGKLGINENMAQWFAERSKITLRFERRFMRDATEHFLLQKHEVLSNLPMFVAESEKIAPSMRVKAAKKKMKKLFDKTASAVAWTTALKQAYSHLNEQAGANVAKIVNRPADYGYGAYSADATPEAGFTYDPNTAAIKDFFNKRTGEGNITNLKDAIGNGIDEETDKQLRATLTEGISEGVGLQELSDRVESVYGAASGYRALRIARTETQQALQFASNAAWSQSAIKPDSWIWLDDGPNACVACHALNNKIFTNLNDVPNGGVLHPNCTCSTVPYSINGVKAFDIPPTTEETSAEVPASVGASYSTVLPAFPTALKFNPNHGDDGRFSTGSGGDTGSSNESGSESGGGSAASANIVEPLKFSDLTEEGQKATGDRASQSLTNEQYQQMAAQGKAQLDAMKANSSPITGLKTNMAELTNKSVDNPINVAYNRIKSFAATREPWGGVTIDPHTGSLLETKGSMFALTARESGMKTIVIPPDATKEQFSYAMSQAMTQFESALTPESHYLGVFYDAGLNQIEIDPAVAVPDLSVAQQIGAYTGAAGGAYNFADGDGYWPPHVGGE